MKRFVRLAKLVLVWERLWRLLWPLAALGLSFTALALFDVLPRLPWVLHAGILSGILAAIIVILLRLRRFRMPTEAEALTRLERDSKLPHRPLRSLSDTLAVGADDPTAQCLWQEQQRRYRQSLRFLRVRFPSPGVAEYDPWALRFIPILLLSISLAGGGQEAAERLERALVPHVTGGSLFGGTAAVLRIWVTPPDYTHLPVVSLSNLPEDKPVAIPSGSRLLAEVQGGHGIARLWLDGKGHRFDSLSKESQKLNMVLTNGQRLAVHQGFSTLGAWPLVVLPDHPPTVAFATPPGQDASGRLRLDIMAEDDYGVAKISLLIRPADEPQTPPLSLELPMGINHPKTVHQSLWRDLTEHVWAGRRVIIEPVAEDDSGQRGIGQAIQAILPERDFKNPVARAIIAQRHVLLMDPTRRVETRLELSAVTQIIAKNNGDLVVFLALSDAVSRLGFDRSPEAITAVLDLLWQSALRLEEENPAEHRLEEARRELQEALDQGAPQAEIDRLIDHLQDTLQDYLRTLAENSQGTAAVAPKGQIVTSDDLQQMIEHLRDLTQTGAREAARQMLGDLQNILDGLRASRTVSEENPMTRQLLDELQRTTADQRSLLDQTYRRAVADPSLPDDDTASSSRLPDSRENGSAEAAQKALRKRLATLFDRVQKSGTKAPESLEQAGEAMDEATLSLRHNRLDHAVDAQTEALSRLQDSIETLRKQGSANRDPLGRAMGNVPGTSNDDGVKIPTQAEAQKARQVLDELRRRSDDAQRPTVERDYLYRLLRSFY